MERELVRARLERARDRLEQNDAYLLQNDLSERCIASRLAMYLREEFTEPELSVDVEYNRHGDTPKRLGLPEECANYRNADGESLVVPDVIVHQRGRPGPNVLVLEMKKTTNPVPRDCDARRVDAFRAQLRYEYGALIECVIDQAPQVRLTFVG